MCKLIPHFYTNFWQVKTEQSLFKIKTGSKHEEKRIPLFVYMSFFTNVLNKYIERNSLPTSIKFNKLMKSEIKSIFFQNNKIYWYSFRFIKNTIKHVGAIVVLLKMHLKHCKHMHFGVIRLLTISIIWIVVSKFLTLFCSPTRKFWQTSLPYVISI